MIFVLACIALVQASSVQFDKATNSVLQKALLGLWEAEHKNFIGMTSKARVELHTMPTQFQTPEERELLHFTAHSKSFPKEGQVVTVTKVLAYSFDVAEASGSTLAEVELRKDLSSEELAKGTLQLVKGDGDLRWELTWSSGDRWHRLADAVKSGEVDEADEAQAAEIGQALLKDWNDECDLDPAVRHRLAESSLGLEVFVGAGAGVGVEHHGVSGEVSVELILTTGSGDGRRARLRCLVRKLVARVQEDEDARLVKLTKDGGDASLAAKMVHELSSVALKAAEQVQAFIGFEGHCQSAVPDLVLKFGFHIVPFPPFVWPVPSFHLKMKFDTTLAKIKECATQTCPKGLVMEALHAAERPPNSEEAARVAELFAEQEAAHKKGAVSMHFKRFWSVGVELELPPAFYVQFGTQAEMDVSSRLVKKKVRSTVFRLFDGSRDRNECSWNREEYFRAVREWSRTLQSMLADPSCVNVHQRLASLAHESGSGLVAADMLANPFALVGKLRQLTDHAFAKSNRTHIHLGEASVEVSATGIGVEVGRVVYNSLEGNVTYAHQCRPFARFVDLYHTRVKPAQDDLAATADCPAGTLPPMQYASCSAVDLPKELPTFPTLTVNAQQEIEAATDSACTRCLAVQSFGAPCLFCGRAVFSSAPSCRQLFSRMPCPKSVSPALDAYDRFPNTPRESRDPRWACAARGHVVKSTKHGGWDFLDEEDWDWLDALLEDLPDLEDEDEDAKPEVYDAAAEEYRSKLAESRAASAEELAEQEADLVPAALSAEDQAKVDKDEIPDLSEDDIEHILKGVDETLADEEEDGARMTELVDFTLKEIGDDWDEEDEAASRAPASPADSTNRVIRRAQ